MAKLQFQLEFLDDIVRTLQSLASTHDDLSRSIASRARTAQARGGSSWVSDQLMYASSILGGHRESLQNESANLRDRLVVARSTAEGWDGNQADLRMALAAVMAAGTGAAAAAQIKGAATKGGVLDESLAVILLAGTKGMASLTNKAGYPRSNDCVQYATAVMEKMGISRRPGDGGGSIYSSSGWTAAGFTRVASGNTPPVIQAPGMTAGQVRSLNDQINKLNAATPAPGSFFEMGQDGDPGNHHTGIYLGSKNGVAYVAQSNWGQAIAEADRPPGVFKVGADGLPHSLSSTEVASLANTPLGSDPGATTSLLSMWHQFGAGGGIVPDSDNQINFYSAPAK